jgi:hypothetical protein
VPQRSGSLQQNGSPLWCCNCPHRQQMPIVIDPSSVSTSNEIVRSGGQQTPSCDAHRSPAAVLQSASAVHTRTGWQLATAAPGATAHSSPKAQHSPLQHFVAQHWFSHALPTQHGAPLTHTSSLCRQLSPAGLLVRLLQTIAGGQHSRRSLPGSDRMKHSQHPLLLKAGQQVSVGERSGSQQIWSRQMSAPAQQVPSRQSPPGQSEGVTQGSPVPARQRCRPVRSFGPQNPLAHSPSFRQIAPNGRPAADAGLASAAATAPASAPSIRRRVCPSARRFVSASKRVPSITMPRFEVRE